MKTGRPFMSIGEVIDALQTDYPDVTVSKIRFLESAGLIDPERTPAGYRKFYQKDLERLRFILKLQRDSYLPLKVIGERLAEYDAGVAGPAVEPAGDGAAAPRPEVERDEDLAEQVAPLSLSEMELANAAGLEPAHVKALRDFGVICEHPGGAGVGPVFDADDLIVARLSREFIRFGIEPRHLKMFRQFADREAMLLQQVVTPMLRHRSPEARKQATQSLSDLSRLVKKLRHAFLRQNLRSFLGAGE